MSRSPIEIALASETKAFRQGIETGVIKPLEDAIKQLRELGDADGADKLEASLKDAQRATEKLGDETKIAAANIEREYRDAARKAKSTLDDVGDAGQRGFGKASTAAGEFKGEALQNFSEVASSFDGSMESIADLAQGTFGGIASALPGVGAAAGVAAIGIGAITNELQAAADRSAAIKEGIINDFLELGDALDAEAVKSRVRDILGTDETRKQAVMLADLLGVSVGQAALTMAGDFESAGVTAKQAIEGISDASGSVDYDTWVRLRDTLKSTEEGFALGKQAVDDLSDAMRRKASADGEAAASAKNATDKAREFFDLVRNGTPIEQTVKFRVDDSEVRRWTPPEKTVTVGTRMTTGRQLQ